MSSGRVSVVVPARDAERYLAQALESALAQTAPPFEVVVVDDGSSDGTSRLAESFGTPVRCLRIDPAGAGAARNHGVAASTGDVVAFLDADDLWRPRKLELQLAALEADAGLELVYGLLDEFVSPELPPAEAAHLRARPGLHPGHVATTLAARRTAFDRVGPFSTSLAVGEFVDWAARANALGLRAATIPHHVASRRVHGRNSTLVRRESLAQLAHILKASLDRQRQGDAS